MSIRDRLSGNEAIATAMRQINPDVFAMFPITPSTEIPQYFAQYVADGKVDTEFICVESEHSSMSACIGAEAAGCRAITATSSATPRFASATTTPAGVESVGKKQNQKDLTQIVVAHGSPYVAQTTFLGNFKDFHEKAHKAIYTEGPTFVNVLCPCPRGWQYSAELLPEICRLAVDTCIWPLYEVENGEYHLTYMPKKKLPVEEFMKLQGRFRHCFKPGNEWTIEAAQNYVDEKWEALLAKCK